MPTHVTRPAVQVWVLGTEPHRIQQLAQALREQSANRGSSVYVHAAPSGTLPLDLRHPSPGHTTLVLLLAKNPPTPTTPATAPVAELRATLGELGIAYTPLWGDNAGCVEQALAALQYALSASTATPSAAPPTWRWHCADCSDAQCERHGFRALLRAEAEKS